MIFFVQIKNNVDPFPQNSEYDQQEKDAGSEVSQLERQNTELVQIVPKVEGDGSHLEQLERLFDRSVIELPPTKTALNFYIGAGGLTSS